MAVPRDIPDKKFYHPNFMPWHGEGYGEFSKYLALTLKKSLVTPDRCWVLYSLLLQALHIDGEVWECGVYKGGTAALLAGVMADKSMGKVLRLFDTFSGMPKVNPSIDRHHEGDFADTLMEKALENVGHSEIVRCHKGFIPDTFKGLEESRICFAHVDVDIYRSIMDCCEFIYPRINRGGFMVFDDYGFSSCPGARKAIDEYFAGKKVVPLVIEDGQAIVFKGNE